MKTLAGLMKAKSSYQRIEYQTVRDDAPEQLRAKATAEWRSRVEAAIKEGNKVLIVPLLFSPMAGLSKVSKNASMASNT